MTWTEPKVAAGSRWTVRTLWRWARAGQVVARRTPGKRGRLLVAVDADGLPVFTPQNDPGLRRGAQATASAR